MLVLAAVGVFFGYSQKQWDKVQVLKGEVAEYRKAVENSKELLKKRDELLNQKNQISDTDLERLETLMPIDVNSTKLILEIQNLASNVHGLAFENPKYDPNKKVTADVKTTTAAGDESAPAKITTPVNPKDAVMSQKEYGVFELEFTVTGSYDKFIGFIQDLEKSLRLVDIQSTQISQKDPTALKYVVKVQTYWLKS
jgi:Tfp pilus assembly protein PilO